MSSRHPKALQKGSDKTSDVTRSSSFVKQARLGRDRMFNVDDRMLFKAYDRCGQEPVGARRAGVGWWDCLAEGKGHKRSAPAPGLGRMHQIGVITGQSSATRPDESLVWLAANRATSGQRLKDAMAPTGHDRIWGRTAHSD